jgi:hypothetical protein
VIRPANGTWFIQNSSNGAVSVTQFGLNGDKAVAGDYVQRRKTDIAVWRPSSGSYFILRSSNGQFQIRNWAKTATFPFTPRRPVATRFETGK